MPNPGIFVALLSFSGLLRSESGPEITQTNENRLEEIHVTGTRGNTTSHHSQTLVSVVNADAIRQDVGQLLPDALRGQAGVFVQQTTPGQAIPIVRGLKGSEVLHLIDGVRLNNALFRNSPNQYLALVDDSWAERIEVQRGPGSTLYGGDAMGGVVQILTHKPAYSNDPLLSQAINTLIDSANLRRSMAYRVEQGQSDFAVSASIRLQETGNRKLASGERINPTGYRSTAIQNKWRWQQNENSEWILDFQFLRQPETPRIDELVPGFGQDEAASEVFLFQPNDRQFVHLSQTHEQPLASIDQWQWDLAIQSIRDDRRSRDRGSNVERQEQNRSVATSLSFQAHQSVFDATQLIWGADINQDKVSSSRLALNILDGNSTQIRSRFPDGSSMDSYALFLNSTTEFSGKGTVSGGLRYSGFNISLPATNNAGRTQLKPRDLTGQVGLLYRLDAHFNWIVNLGRGFRPPNVFDLGTLGDRPGNRFNIANRDLKPETVLTLDTGFKYLSANTAAEIVVFASDYRDKITSVSTGLRTESGRDIVQNRNANSVKLHGLEASFHVILDNNWDLRGAVNYLYGKEIQIGGEIAPADRIPPLNALLKLTHRLRENLSWHLRLRSAGRQDRLSRRDVRDPRINPLGTGGWAGADLGLSWQPNKVLDLAAKVENIFNKAYREHGSGIDAGGRNYVLQATLSF